MAAASSTNPIKQVVGSTYSAGFDLTARTAIDGRMAVATLSDLTNEATWRSRSEKDAQHPQYWLYNGLVTSVAATGKIYVLVGIDESQPSTYWPAPAAPGIVATGPRWVEVGGADNFLQEAELVDAKYGFISTEQTEAEYYESGDPNYEHVYTDNTLTVEVESRKYLKFVVKESSGEGNSTIKVIYCDIQDLIKNVGQPLNIRGEGTVAASFDGTEVKNINFVGMNNVAISTAQNSGFITTSLQWNIVVEREFNIPGPIRLKKADITQMPWAWLDPDGLHLVDEEHRSLITEYKPVWPIKSPGGNFVFKCRYCVPRGTDEHARVSKMIFELLDQDDNVVYTHTTPQSHSGSWDDETPSWTLSEGMYKLRLSFDRAWHTGYFESLRVDAAQEE